MKLCERVVYFEDDVDQMSEMQSSRRKHQKTKPAASGLLQ
jgi:hypothetical protein